LSYVQNTDADRAAMLEAIGARSVDELLDAIPADCRLQIDLAIDRALTEDELLRHARELASRNVSADEHPCFLGAGSYRHFVPALVDGLAARTEFWTAYTPYQPEASQGTLTTIYEFQSMMCRLTGMEVSNASVYDGATALVEGVLLALRMKRGARRVVASRGVHHEYREALATYLRHIDVELVEVDLQDGATAADAIGGEDVAAVAVQSPNFYGVVEDVGALCDRAHALGAMAVVVADPVSLSVLEAPGHQGADVVCGDGNWIGNKPWFGGPGFGFLCARMEAVRQMPARIAGETVDAEGRRAVVLTFQTREQHIRRTKATSNICTSQQLMALRATITMALLGRQGFVELGRTNLSRAHYAAEHITALPGYALTFPERAFFKEFCVETPRPAAEINRRLLDEHGILGGFDVARVDPAATHRWLVAVTDANPREQIDRLVSALEGLS